MEEKRLLLAVVLSVAILFAWQFMFPTEKPQPEKSTAVEEPASPGATSEVQVEPTPVSTREIAIGKPEKATSVIKPSEIVPIEQGGPETVTIDTDLYRCVLSTAGGGIKLLELKDYRTTQAPDAPLVKVVEDTMPAGMMPLSAELTIDGKTLPSDADYRAENEKLELIGSGSPESGTVSMVMRIGAGFEVERRYKFKKDSYDIELEIEVREFSLSTSEQVFPGKADVEMALAWNNLVNDEKAGNRFAFYGTIAKQGEDYEDVRVAKVRKKGPFSYNGVSWCGFAEAYFLAVMIPRGDGPVDYKAEMGETDKKEFVHGVMTFPDGTLKPGSPLDYRVTIYAGPKDRQLLAKLGKGLEDAVGYGRLKLIIVPLIWVLRFFQKYVHNWGLAIILLTVFVKILFFPLTRKSYESMKAMQALQPRIKELQEKYKDDREKMNSEMMALYRTHKINPLGGCLPMLLQLPVLYALYRALYVSIELRHAPFVGWINDLSAPESLLVLPVFGGYPVGFMPFLMGASMYVQQKMSPTASSDPMQAKMFAAMPVIFTFISFGFPSGLVLYWFVSNLLTIIQQYVINRKGI